MEQHFELIGVVKNKKKFMGFALILPAKEFASFPCLISYLFMSVYLYRKWAGPAGDLLKKAKLNIIFFCCCYCSLINIVCM